ncbi:MAG: hypothetical protein JXB19_06585 [Bacteroidales bacterium]|nr:hypothetical protein [Bacteroidales bacterium]
MDKGEASSIALALEIKDSTLIIEETKGRRIVKSYNIDIIGTIWILLLADNCGLIKDFLSVILKLVNTKFLVTVKYTRDHRIYAVTGCNIIKSIEKNGKPIKMICKMDMETYIYLIQYKGKKFISWQKKTLSTAENPKMFSI